MKEIDKIKMKFMLFEEDMSSVCRDDVKAYLECEDLETQYNYRGILKAIKSDEVSLFFERILTSLGLSDEVEQYYLSEDIEILSSYKESVMVYELLYQRLLFNITDDNYLDIYRLGSFMGQQILEVDNYYDLVLESLQLSYQGITCIPGGEDNTEAFREFFEDELGKILSKGKEKIKK